MCDYSLQTFRNRPAVDGEPLIVYRFPSGVLGLASPTDLQQPADERAAETTILRFCRAAIRWLNPVVRCPAAICVSPGTQLLLRDIPERLQEQMQVDPEEEVTVTQNAVAPYQYRDAVYFKNGKEIPVQRLSEGQRVDVLCVAREEWAGREGAPELLALSRWM